MQFIQGSSESSQDWQSLLEAIERDIMQLNNHPGYRELHESLGDESRPSDIFTKQANMKGPWTQIAFKIKKDLEDTAAINVKIEQLNEKVKEQAKSYIILKKEKDEQVLINQNI